MKGTALDEIQLSDRALGLLNGHSVRRIRSGRLADGDLLFGEIVERRQGRRGDSLIVRLREPGRFCGEPLEEGDWVRVVCTGGVLRRLLRVDDPQPGDMFAVQHHGHVGGRLELVAGIEKRQEQATANREAW
jgi:hypothetical protein